MAKRSDPKNSDPKKADTGKADPKKTNPKKTNQGSDRGRANRVDGAQIAKGGVDSSVPETLRHLTKLAEDFMHAVEECSTEPHKEPVHVLRTGSRRVQAMVETTIREAGSAGSALERPTRRWLRQLKKIRRAGGVVRDLDVQRGLLDDLLEAHAQDDAAQTLKDQASRLDDALKAERDDLAARLTKQIKARKNKLAGRQAEWFEAARQIHPDQHGQRPAADVALEDFVRLADAMPMLDAANLHEFRKATKKARYVAESGGESARAGQVAKALKRVQDVIGEWHDWQGLADEAKANLPAGQPELSTLLQSEADRHFLSAKRTTERLRGRLIGEWRSAQREGAASSPGKKASRPAKPSPHPSSNRHASTQHARSA